MSRSVVLRGGAWQPLGRARRHRRSVGSPWLAMLTDRAARRQMLVVAALVAILVAVPLYLLARGVRQEQEARNSLAELLGAGRLVAGPPSIITDVVSEPPPLVGEQAAAQNAQAPFLALGPAAQPYRFIGALPDRLRARACLAAAMLYEAGDDPVGQLAVGQVVLNRVRHPAFPASVCGVVTQGSDRATGCQFTFTCDGSLSRLINAAARARALAHADLMLDGMVFAGVGLATHYHTVDVYPWWSPRLEKIARVGAHVFFRWPGYWGSAGAVLARRSEPEASARLFAQFGGTEEPEVQLVSLSEPDSGMEPEVEPGATRAMADARPELAMKRSATSPAAIPLARRLTGDAPHVDQSRPSLVGAPSFEGSRLLRMFPEQGVFFLEVSQASDEAARRRTASLLCGGRADCHVYGWRNAGSAPAGAQLDPASKASLAFTYSRTAPSKAHTAAPSAQPMTDAW